MMDMRNLLQETLDAMGDAGKTQDDVAWVGSRDGRFVTTWDEFKEIADREYDAGHSSQNVTLDLVVVFKDGSFMVRREYDGAEWWEYMATPRPSAEPRPIKRIFADDCGGVGWYDLEELNDDDRCEEIKRLNDQDEC